MGDTVFVKVFAFVVNEGIITLNYETNRWILPFRILEL